MGASCHSSLLLALVVGASLSQVYGQSWSQTSAPSNYWSCIACSADGAKVVALGGWSIYLSTNSGLTWEAKVAPTGPWLCASSSADGDRLVAAQDDDFVQLLVYASTNSGADWLLANSMGYTRGLGSSADGGRVVRVESPRASHNANVGNIYSSTNGGIDWITTSAPLLRWQAVACSAEGSKLVAGCYGSDSGGGLIYCSTNFGANWNPTTSPLKVWSALASSADGTWLVAAAHYDAGGYNFPGSVYVSGDAGLSWYSSTPSAYWSGVACSSDGKQVVAVAGELAFATGPIYSSDDWGATWTSNNAPILSWSSVAGSADGATRFATAYNGGIYRWQGTPTPVLKTSVSGVDLILSWTVPSMNFVLQQSQAVAPGEWTKVAVAPVLNYSNMQYEVSISKPEGTMFYRLVSQ